MTAEWFDLGQRLYAARTRSPVPRLLHAPVPVIGAPVAVRARSEGRSVVVTASNPTTPARTGRDDDALTLLGEMGVQVTADTWQTLITDDPGTLAALLLLARRCPPDSQHAAVAAHIAWWDERNDFPGSSATVQLLDACRARWVLGVAPEAEDRASTWRTWLHTADDGCAGLLAILDRLTDAPPLALLGSLVEDDAWTWAKARSEHTDRWDWRRPDTASRAANGLRARCDAADLYAGALLSDPLYRQRAVHSGHVVIADVQAAPAGRNTVALLCERMDARLRTGNAVTGWVGQPDDTAPQPFAGTVTGTGVHGVRLLLTLGTVTSNRPDPGQQVTLTPAAPNPFTMRAGRRRYARLYGTRRSWLTTGRTPSPTRREVPLDVLVAGAEDD